MSLEQAKDRIYQLEDAVERLDYVRKQLARNSSEICGEIRGSIGRSVECLRNRELALLGEVDKVRGIKEGTLQLQQGRLNQAINILHTAITLVMEDSASEKHLADTLVRLNHLEMSPEESPYISFHADQLQLRENVFSYGRVDANGLPPSMVFDDPVKPSASLPRHLEEYEDVDHHVFNKTLQQVQMKPTVSTSIKVSIPKLSQRVEDWLQQKPKKTLYTAEEIRSKTDQDIVKAARMSRPSTLAAIRPASSGALSQMTDPYTSPHRAHSQMPSPESSCSLNNWLSLIKNNADLEEEHDFEIVDNSLRNHNELSPQKQTISPDLKKWLCPTSTESPPVSTDFFNHIGKDSNAWLHSVRHQLTSIEELKQKDFCQHISRESTTWLRSRAYSRPYNNDSSETNDPFSHITKDKNKWLAPKVCPPCRDVIIDTEMKCTSAGRSSPSQEKWLLQSERCASVPQRMVLSQQPAFPEPMAAPLNSSSSTWLLKPNTTTANNERQSIQQSSQVVPVSLDSPWLLKSFDSCYSRNEEPCDTSDGVNDDAIWLVNTSQQEPDSSCRSGSTQNLSDWLFLPNTQNSQVLTAGCTESDKASCSDSWSICSVPHSVSSDQHAKDVATASNYYNKWLL